MTLSVPKGRLAAAALVVLLAVASSTVHGALPDPVRFGVTIEAGNIRAAKSWLDAGVDPDFMADRIGTGLMIAAWYGDLPMMELFLSRGADINKTNGVQEQALMHAAWRGQRDAVRWLLDHGARIDRDGRQWSALHYAVFAGHEAIAQLLIERGANINARATNGSSVLMMAAREGRDGLVRTLLEHGADARVTNDAGDDALKWAMRYEHVRIAKMVANPEQFADAARAPRESFGAAVRSAPVPERIDTLFREVRVAEAEGRPADDLREAYAMALAELAKRRLTPAAENAARSNVPTALEISAKRDAPGQEKAMLIYDTGHEEPLAGKGPETKPAKRSTPKQKSATGGK